MSVQDTALRAAISIALNLSLDDDEAVLQRVAALNAGLLDMLANRETTPIGPLAEQLDRIEAKVDAIMAIQDDINAALAGDDAALKAVAARVTSIEAGLRSQITTLKDANPSIDTAGLLAHLATLKETAEAIDAAEPVAASAAPLEAAAVDAPPVPDASPVADAPVADEPVAEAPSA